MAVADGKKERDPTTLKKPFLFFFFSFFSVVINQYDNKTAIF